MASAAGRLVLVRHGESVWNASGRWQGHGGSGLSRQGRLQAEATANRLVAELDDVALIARSDLQRVAETAAPLEAVLAVPVVVDERLRELDCGRWTGLTHEEIAAAEPDVYEACVRGDDVAFGGGERVADLQGRVLACLRDVIEQAGGSDAVVVTHGGPIRVGVAGLLGRRVTRLDDGCEPVTNCSVTIVDLRDGGPTVERYGDGSHLAAPGQPGVQGPL